MSNKERLQEEQFSTNNHQPDSGNNSYMSNRKRSRSRSKSPANVKINYNQPSEVSQPRNYDNHNNQNERTKSQPNNNTHNPKNNTHDPKSDNLQSQFHYREDQNSMPPKHPSQQKEMRKKHTTENNYNRPKNNQYDDSDEYSNQRDKPRNKTRNDSNYDNNEMKQKYDSVQDDEALNNHENTINNSQYMNSHNAIANNDLQKRLNKINQSANNDSQMKNFMNNEDSDEEWGKRISRTKYSNVINQKPEQEGMDDLYFEEEALDPQNPVLQLLRLTQDKRQLINKVALRLLAGIDKNIAIISVAGPYRTGKSYLLNRFAGKQYGFDLGATTNPCTNGLWIWGEPIPLNDETSVILLDTEGLNSYNRDENQDMVLFCITAMLSSTMLYNNFGAIDEKAIERLGFLCQLSKLFKFKEKRVNSHQEQMMEIAKYFPSLVWVLRDFGQDLYDESQGREITAKEYQETSLLINTKGGERYKQGQAIRNTIREFFSDRTCVPQVRPLGDEKLLRNIEQQEYSTLRPEFRQATENLINMVTNNLKPKIVDNVPVNGSGYTKLVQFLVKALNTTGLNEIQTTWDRIVQTEMKGTLKQAYKVFEEGLEVIEKKLPMEDSEFFTKLYYVKMASATELNKFRYSNAKCNIMRDIFDTRIKALEDSLIANNQAVSKKICQNISKQVISEISVKMNPQYTDLSPGFALTTYHDIRNSYLERALGTYKYDVLINEISSSFILALESMFDKKHHKILTERNNFEIAKEDFRGKYDASKIILDKQRDMSEALMHQTKEGYCEQLKFYEERIDLMKDNYEGRLNDVHSQLDDTKKEKNKQEKSTKYINENMVNFNEIKRMNENFGLMMKELKKSSDTENSDRVNNMIDKEKIKMEGKFQSDLFKFKKTNDMELDKIKHSYDKEIDAYKENIKRLEIIRQENLSIILQKEAEIRLLQEKIRNEEKNKHTKMEQADMICKISDKVMQMLKKMDYKMSSEQMGSYRSEKR